MHGVARAIQIEGVGGFSDLRLLELGSNRLRRIAGLDHMTRLEELWLGRNRIAAIDGLSQCAGRLIGRLICPVYAWHDVAELVTLSGDLVCHAVCVTRLNLRPQSIIVRQRSTWVARRRRVPDNHRLSDVPDSW